MSKNLPRHYLYYVTMNLVWTFISVSTLWESPADQKTGPPSVSIFPFHAVQTSVCPLHQKINNNWIWLHIVGWKKCALVPKVLVFVRVCLMDGYLYVCVCFWIVHVYLPVLCLCSLCWCVSVCLCSCASVCLYKYVWRNFEWKVEFIYSFPKKCQEGGKSFHLCESRCQCRVVRTDSTALPNRLRSSPKIT